MKSSLTVILFDLDETLVDREATMAHFLEGQHGRFQEHLSLTQADFCERVLDHQQGGYADKLTAYARALDRDAGDPLLDLLMTDFKEQYGTDAICFDGTREVLTALHDTCRLGVVTNGRSRGQRKKLESTGILPFFDSVSISEEVGIKKPDTGLFLHGLEILKVSPDQVMMVGDNPANDIAPAVMLGMRGVWLDNERFEAPNCDHDVIHGLRELLQLLNTDCGGKV